MVLVECGECGYMKPEGAGCVVCACELTRRLNETLARIREDAVRRLGDDLGGGL